MLIAQVSAINLSAIQRVLSDISRESRNSDIVCAWAEVSDACKHVYNIINPFDHITRQLMTQDKEFKEKITALKVDIFKEYSGKRNRKTNRETNTKCVKKP